MAVTISGVRKHSPAYRHGIQAGERLLTLNGNEIMDVLDYRFYQLNTALVLELENNRGERRTVSLKKPEYEEIGLEFETYLMDRQHSCKNKCVFCFIDQLPKGLRKSLYFKDDDSRLSFLQGNYITLTNMKERDIERIIRMQLAPINISVQTTNPQLRCKMLNNRFAGDKLKYLQMLYDGHVEMNGQVVCCKNVNDGAELERTIRDLSRYLPFLRSVSVVPAGITKFREGLFPIELYTKEEAGAVIDMVESRQQEFYEQYGLHFIHASDEWYITAGRDFPEEERYDGYIQLENGVGMMRMFINEFNEALEDVISKKEYEELAGTVSRTLTIATGKLTYPTICGFAGKLMDAFPYLTVHVYAIRNDFFGETITVSGLITGQDLIGQLKERQAAGEDLGEVLQIPSNMLRVGEQVFLDDLTVRDVERELGMKVVAVESGGREFIDAILDPEYRMERKNDNFVYIQAYDRK